MGSWRPKLPGFGEGSHRLLSPVVMVVGEVLEEEVPVAAVAPTINNSHKMVVELATTTTSMDKDLLSQPRGAMMSQRWQPAGPAAGYLCQGQAYREVQASHYYGRGGLSAVAPELRQAMETSHEPDNISPEAGSPDLSPRASTVEVTVDQLKDLSVQDESSMCQEIVQAFLVSSNAYKFPHCPGSRSIGTSCLVKANHFFAELPNKDLHQYDAPGVSFLFFKRREMCGFMFCN